MIILDQITTLTKQLLPEGRAFKVAENSYLDNLIKALSLSENKAYNDALSIQNAILPDNPDFTEEDADDWERRLGMITGQSVDLELRKQAIQRKMNHPGDIKARQHYLYIQGQLQAAGFEVWVHENRFPYGDSYYTQTIFDVLGSGGVSAVQHGDIQHGDAQHGGVYKNIIVNYIDEDMDNNFFVPDNQRATFFIGGEILGTYANIPANRKKEFRQLILRLKPVQMVGYLIVNYV